MELLQKYNLSNFKNVKSIELNSYDTQWDKISLNNILTSNEIWDFRSEISKISLNEFAKLEHFKMSDDSELDESFFNSNSLKTLYLQNVKFSSRLKFDLPNLSELTLSNVNCSSLNKSICNSLNLENLSMWKVQFKKLPDEISNLVKLKKITVYNNLETIENIQFPDSLEEIDFRANKLEVIPDSILKLSNIKSIDLSDNKFSKFPIIENNNLTKLSLRDTPFGIFKSNVEKLKNKCKNSEILGGMNGFYVEEKEEKGIYLPQTKKYYYPDKIEGTTQMRW